MQPRTDLAIELRELSKRPDDGIISEQEQKNGLKITRIKIVNERGAKSMGRPIGRYVTIEAQAKSIAQIEEEECIAALGSELKKMLGGACSVLVCGIGNHNITPDALGPKSASKILATRHLSEELTQAAGLGKLSSVSVISPGVLGQTGIEIGEIIKGVVQRTKPSAVIAIDALAARNVSRLCRTFQLSDTGIVPGSGVHNARNELSYNTLGVPVISVGVPTVVDMKTLICDLASGEQPSDDEDMIVTPREIDNIIENTSTIVAMGINITLHPHISLEDMQMLVK